MPRPKYHDLKPGDFGEQLAPYDFVELKYDGLYAEFIGNADGWSIHGRNGALLRYGDEPCPDCYLRGEMIEGTEWAAHSDNHGRFMAWDCIYSVTRNDLQMVGGEATAPKDFYDSACRCEGASDCLDVFRFDFMDAADHWPVMAAKAKWDQMVIKYGFEGLVFRSADGQRYGRMKRIVTQDYVLTGVRRQGPRVTALFGGLWIDGVLETVCTVPVKAATAQAAPVRDVGSVFEANGNSVLKSGALRHPRQANSDGSVRWRADKAARECEL